MIGVSIEDLRRSVKEGLRIASDMQFRAVELSCAEGELSPANLSASGRRHLRRHCENLGLQISTLTADFSGLRLTDPAAVDERIARTCEVLELAADLGVGVVSSGFAALTHPDTEQPSSQTIDALHRMGEFADRCSVQFSLRPSSDTASGVANVLDALCCPAIGIGLDPAAAVMSGVDPVSVLQKVVENVNVVHARDAKTGRGDAGGCEVVFGQGDVDYVGVLAILQAAQYSGSYILRRRDSLSPMEDIGHARDVLAGHFSPNRR